MLRTSTFAILGLAITGPAAAHHGFGTFDLRSDIELTFVDYAGEAAGNARAEAERPWWKFWD